MTTRSTRTTTKRKVSTKPARGTDNEVPTSGKHEGMITADRERTQQLFGAIEESMKIMSERLQAGDTTREAANTFLICVSNRFDKFAKPDWHARFGYEHSGGQIQDNLRRIEQNLSRKTLLPDHGRIDTVLNDLVSEVMRLAQSQTTFCESCEHCLRERYLDGDSHLLGGERFSTDATLDHEMWEYVADRFSEAFTGGVEGEQELILALRHIESLAWVGRPGAVKDAVNQLINNMMVGSMNNSELREAFERNALEGVKRVKQVVETDE